MPRRPRLSFALAPLVSGILAVPLLVGPAQAADPDPTSPARRLESTPAAARALAAAQDLGAPGGRDATLVLRDLRAHRTELGTADRAAAAQILQRPGGDRSRCFSTVCVHWSSTGPDKATQGYVSRVAKVAQHVLATYAAAGYRAPEPDGTSGGNGLLDIYLQDLGSRGLYGYCDSDDPPTGTGPFDAPAYCAFDNNYREFPAHTPLENLEVTAAHELFHAVQFAYDYYEDAWFMEATATWAEDELYDGVDDNLQYLAQSPLRQPARSMDHFENAGYRQYGDWIFFRYLTEHDPAAAGGLPTLVRAMWDRADGSADGPDDYSIQAVARVLADRGGRLTSSWAAFAAANRRPGSSYEEGKANDYPAAPLARRVSLTGTHRSSGWLTQRVDHLAADTVRIDRASGMAARSLEIHLDLPATSRGSGVVVTVVHTTGRPVTRAVRLTADGNATTRVGFRGSVKAVEVTLANAGIHYRDCYRGTAWSCQGRPLDDDLALRMRANALR